MTEQHHERYQESDQPPTTERIARAAEERQANEPAQKPPEQHAKPMGRAKTEALLFSDEQRKEYNSRWD